ncbi:MAG TPA: TetR/AcrR family transcriptional regulator [Steroidobacteraceae bacterium]|nr:TetR/AcrR family transcriptional regulator [Steroidobacteraceae bacterium]
MLTAAAQLFEKKGFAATTFSEIAAAAGVGVATVYKYFGTKEGIVVALLRPSLGRMIAKGQRVVDEPPADPVQAVIGLMSVYWDLVREHDWSQREILRLTVFPGLGAGEALAQFTKECDARTQELIHTLLKSLRAAGRVSPRLSLRDATAIIFALLNQQFGIYLTGDRPDVEHDFKLLTRRIRALFDDWRA